MSRSASTVIDAPIDEVWQLLRDFNTHDRWHPAVAVSRIEERRERTRSDACATLRSPPAERCASSSCRCPTGTTASPIASSMRRCRSTATSRPCGSSPSPTGTAPSGTGSPSSSRHPTGRRSSPAWWARTSTKAVSAPSRRSLPGRRPSARRPSTPGPCRPRHRRLPARGRLRRRGSRAPWRP